MHSLNFRLLNQQGLAHFVVPLLVVLIVGVVGTYMLVSSHADNLPVPSGGGTVDMYKKPGRLIISQMVGKEVADEVGMNDEDRTYVIQVQGAGAARDDRVARAIGLRFTTNPVKGAKVKLSSYNRSKTHGCGHNGPTGHQL